MSETPIVLSSGEAGGSLEIREGEVRRRLGAAQWREASAALRALGTPGSLGLVPWTEVASEGDWVTLRHPRVRVISYPHEWCGEMLWEAARLHARLFSALAPHGLWLKDAHPWNVLFEDARPCFVDVGSILPAASLASLDYLAGARDPAAEVLRLMFEPYFTVPLAFHRAGLGDAARRVLWRLPLNGAPRRPNPADYLAGLKPRQLPGAVRALLAVASEARAWRGPAEGRAERLAARVDRLAPVPAESAYTAYYAEKGETQALDRPQDWNDKQRGAIGFLDDPEVVSVLDIGCNTGWYSRAAARRGKRVTAVDVDGVCVSALYRAVRESGEAVTPLVLDALAPTPDRERSGGGLLMIGAERRLRSDAVLALGLLHHLVLGAGERLEAALARLGRLSRRRLVVEFVGREDPLVRGDPGFFPAHARRPGDFEGYGLQAACEVLRGQGWQVETAASHPAHRTLILARRAA